MSRIVRVLLEQVVSSTIERCVDPQLMEQSVSVPPSLPAFVLNTFLRNNYRWLRSFVNGTKKHVITLSPQQPSQELIVLGILVLSTHL